MFLSTLSPFEPPQTRLAHDEIEPNPIKSGLLFLLKCIVFAVVFWTVWIFAMRPLSTAVSNSSTASSAQAQDAQQEALMRKYWEQARAADELQAKSEKLMAKQEQLLTRFEAVIQRWESLPTGKK